MKDLPSFDSFGKAVSEETWPPQTILVSDWLISNKSSPLKPLGQMNRNVVGRIAYGGHVCWWIGTKWAIFREDLP
jgi:hypothetical protein